MASLGCGNSIRFFADMVAGDGDSLADITVMEKVVFVMKGGEVYKSVK